MSTITRENFEKDLKAFVSATESTESPWTLELFDEGSLFGKRKIVKTMPIDTEDGCNQSDDEEGGFLEEINNHSINIPNQKVVQFEYHIIYSESYSVPVLYFTAIDAGGKYLGLEEVWRLIPKVYRPESGRLNSDEESSEQLFATLSSMVTQREHPFLGTPFYWVHPCQTTVMMEKVSNLTAINFSSQQTRSNYIITWLSTYGPIVGLRLQLDMPVKINQGIIMSATVFGGTNNNDYEALVNCSQPNLPEKSSQEKRGKPTNMINKIRRFARSQSQIRRPSRNHESMVSDNFVNRTKDLYRDVKRRFSSFNSPADSPTDRRAPLSIQVLSQPKSMVSSSEMISNVARLRRYASDESIPSSLSESGCGSSVKTGSMSTDSNRSSICTMNDSFSNDSGLFKGPFIGRGVALVDCTPCPYDKDALAFKKGDLVNIIAKNDSGTWIGMANGKIGHFKFITVEETSSLGMRSLTPPKDQTQSSGSYASSLTAATTLMDSSSPSISSFCGTLYRYEDALNNLISTVNIYLENSLKTLLKMIDLDEFDYLVSLSDRGFKSLESLKAITDASTLENLGITRKDHQQLFLLVASLLRAFIEKDAEKNATVIDGELSLRCSSLSLEKDLPSSSSLLTSSSELFLCSMPNKVSDAQESSRDGSYGSKRSEKDSKELKSSHSDNKKNSALSSYRRKRDRRQSEGESIKRAQSGGNLVIDNLILHDNKKNTSLCNRNSLDTNVLIKKLEHGYEIKNNLCCELRKPAKTLSTSKSVLDLKCGDNPPNEESPTSCSHPTKKRFKKLLNPERKSINTVQYDETRQTSLNSKSLSSSLFETLTAVLREENIDLAMEPYSDNSGFCGIPPALVQRYAEELESDVYDVAETLDHIRLHILAIRYGKQGIPNDFLADSCNGPGTDWANYDNLHNWLLSLGLPMYEKKLRDNGWNSLYDAVSVREDDLVACGITDKRHLRLLTTAIGALSVNQHRIGKS